VPDCPINYGRSGVVIAPTTADTVGWRMILLTADMVGLYSNEYFEYSAVVRDMLDNSGHLRIENGIDEWRRN